MWSYHPTALSFVVSTMIDTLVHCAFVGGYLDGLTAETFSVVDYLAQFPVRIFVDPHATELRIALSKNDPLLFALLYLRHHLAGAETENTLTFSDFHLDLCRQRDRYIKRVTEPATLRDAYVAPRGVGKSTWLFLIMPLWAAAHGHRKFAAAFADSSSQAEQHLETFKRELNTNALLRCDYPNLCKPLTRMDEERRIADNRRIVQCSNGFVFAARGIEASTLGTKVGNLRPDLLILDDIEPGEETYSIYQARQRLIAITDNVFPLNVFAQVVMVGTTTMAGSIMHQIVRVGLGESDESTVWVDTENISVHYYAPILTREDGTERSLWPAKWPLAFLNSIRHTRQYAKNYANLPVAIDGEYWGDEDFPAGEVEAVTRFMLSIDPAVTDKKGSDFTGIAVVGYSPTVRRAQVFYTVKVKLSTTKLRELVLRICGHYPIRLIMIESNQGGDLWYQALGDIPGAKIALIHQSDSKEVRAARLLAHCQALPPRVLFGQDPVRDHAAFREEAMSFPHGLNDDLVDAVGTGVEYFLRWASQSEESRRRLPLQGRAISYVGRT